MSFPIIHPSITGVGLPLGESLELVTPQFLVYECGYSTGIKNWNFDPKRTPFWCFWHVLNDDEDNWIEGIDKRWKVGPDRLLMAPAQVVYSSHNIRPVPQIWLHFSPIPDYAFEASALFEIPVDALLREQIAALIEDYDAAKKGDTRILYHHALALLNNCFARHPLPLRVLSDSLRSVLHRIESDPAGDLSNTRLARSVGMSMCTFISWFEAQMNQSPGAYVRYVRYQKASRMLILSDASIEQIAAELGYPNRHYFSRAFARHAGHGPATFRKQHQNRQNV